MPRAQAAQGVFWDILGPWDTEEDDRVEPAGCLRMAIHAGRSSSIQWEDRKLLDSQALLSNVDPGCFHTSRLFH